MEKLVIQSRRDFYKLYSLMDRETENQSIELYLEMSFLEPMDILILTQFAIVQGNRSSDITLCTSPTVRKYLEEIELVRFVDTNTYNPTTIDAILSYTAMPIRRVERETMVEYITATEKYFETICQGKDLAMLNLCMSELINNVYDHSHSGIGAYVFCQFYPKSNEIQMAVSDYGIGIPKSVNIYRLGLLEEPLSNSECVKWAIKENKTTHSIPQNAGKGLDNINSFVGKNEGFWNLYTDNVLLTGGSSGNKYSENDIYGFKGTVVQVTIKLENLDDSEFVESLEWDF